MLTKLASRASTYPGDVILFMVTYKNLTEVPYEDVVITDSLPPELVYVEGSAKSSRETEITVERSASGTVQIHWKIHGTVEPGESGLVTFRARVRTHELFPEQP